jgi:choline monooxygenase
VACIVNDLSETRTAPSLARAEALPAEFYCAPHMATLDRQAVFEASWQLVGHGGRLRETGDHLVTGIAGLPLIVLRDDPGRIRAFHNVCRHRAGPLATADGCGARRLRCRYHGWTYGLDGVLRSAPEMEGAADFDPAAIRLPEVEVAIWRGLVFVALGDAPDFKAFTAALEAQVGGLGIEDLHFARRVVYELDCDWKVYVDNYLEGYHVPHVHPGLNQLLDYRGYRTEMHDWCSIQSSRIEDEDGRYGVGEARYVFLWPNAMLNCLPGRLQTNRVLPRGVGRCRVEFDYYYADAGGDADEAARREADERFSDDVQAEDRMICEQVQRGLASGSYVPGRLSPRREGGVHHFHELLRQAYRRHGGA